jgi:hypothetical protein
MKTIFSIILLATIFLTLYCYDSKVILERYDDTVDIEEIEEGLNVIKSTFPVSQTTELIENNNDVKLEIKSLILNEFINRVLGIRLAKEIFQFDKYDKNVLTKLIDKINENEKAIVTKNELKVNTECLDFSKYCKHEDGTFNSLPSNYISLNYSQFYDLLDKCYLICDLDTLQDVENEKDFIFKTIFELLVRNEILQKPTGKLTDITNVDTFEYIVNYEDKANLSINPNSFFNMEVFDTSHERYTRIKYEIESLIKIYELKLNSKFLIEQKNKDIKLEILSNYEINYTLHKYS